MHISRKFKVYKLTKIRRIKNLYICFGFTKQASKYWEAKTGKYLDPWKYGPPGSNLGGVFELEDQKGKKFIIIWLPDLLEKSSDIIFSLHASVMSLVNSVIKEEKKQNEKLNLMFSIMNSVYIKYFKHKL